MRYVVLIQNVCQVCRIESPLELILLNTRWIECFQRKKLFNTTKIYQNSTISFQEPPWQMMGCRTGDSMHLFHVLFLRFCWTTIYYHQSTLKMSSPAVQKSHLFSNCLPNILRPTKCNFLHQLQIHWLSWCLFGKF